ncbi:MAG: hydrogenase maturation protease [Candidatus Zixiibacteriota bacterium]
MQPESSHVVIGLGNEFRSDDGGGPTAARRVGRLCGRRVQVIAPLTDGAGLVMLWGEVELVILIDSVKSGSPPGTVFRFEPLREEIPEEVFHPTTTHRFSVSQIIRLARVLGRLPKQLIVYGIEGVDFDYGTTMSPAVAAAAIEVADRIAAEIMQFSHETAAC